MKKSKGNFQPRDFTSGIFRQIEQHADIPVECRAQGHPIEYYYGSAYDTEQQLHQSQPEIAISYSLSRRLAGYVYAILNSLRK